MQHQNLALMLLEITSLQTLSSQKHEKELYIGWKKLTVRYQLPRFLICLVWHKEILALTKQFSARPSDSFINLEITDSSIKLLQ